MIPLCCFYYPELDHELMLDVLFGRNQLRKQPRKVPPKKDPKTMKKSVVPKTFKKLVIPRSRGKP